MTRSEFSEQQIISILKQAENGRTVAEVCREAGVSTATYFKWKSKYGGKEASDIRKMREPEEENRQLKRMYAELTKSVVFGVNTSEEMVYRNLKPSKTRENCK